MINDNARGGITPVLGFQAQEGLQIGALPRLSIPAAPVT